LLGHRSHHPPEGGGGVEGERAEFPLHRGGVVGEPLAEQLAEVDPLLLGGREGGGQVAGERLLEGHDLRRDGVRPQHALDGMHPDHPLPVEQVGVRALRQKTVVPLVGGGVQAGEQHRDGALDVLIGDAGLHPAPLHLCRLRRAPGAEGGRGGLERAGGGGERCELLPDIGLHIEDRLSLRIDLLVVVVGTRDQQPYRRLKNRHHSPST
jgi:hypothetical protein